MSALYSTLPDDGGRVYRLAQQIRSLMSRNGPSPLACVNQYPLRATPVAVSESEGHMVEKSILIPAGDRIDIVRVGSSGTNLDLFVRLPESARVYLLDTPAAWNALVLASECQGLAGYLADQDLALPADTSWQTPAQRKKRREALGQEEIPPPLPHLPPFDTPIRRKDDSVELPPALLAMIEEMTEPNLGDF